MSYYIKYINRPCCRNKVQAELDIMGISFEEVAPGLFELKEYIAPEQHEKLLALLHPRHLELTGDHEQILIHKIEHLIIYRFQHNEDGKKIIISEYLSRQVNKNYNYLSNVYKAGRGSTIQDFVNGYKFEKIKEWLPGNRYTLDEICDKLQFSSKAHLCRWFKTKSGYTISDFRKKA